MVKYYLCLREIDLCSLYEELEDTKRGNQNPYIEEEQTTQWPKEKVQKDKQRSRKQIYKTKDQVRRSQHKTGVELRCSRNDTRHVNLVANQVISRE